jgi:hypothetical protein
LQNSTLAELKELLVTHLVKKMAEGTHSSGRQVRSTIKDNTIITYPMAGIAITVTVSIKEITFKGGPYPEGNVMVAGEGYGAPRDSQNPAFKTTKVTTLSGANRWRILGKNAQMSIESRDNGGTMEACRGEQ